MGTSSLCSIIQIHDLLKVLKNFFRIDELFLIDSG